MAMDSTQQNLINFYKQNQSSYVILGQPTSRDIGDLDTPRQNLADLKRPQDVNGLNAIQNYIGMIGNFDGTQGMINSINASLNTASTAFANGAVVTTNNAARPSARPKGR
jgi:hypothetical protein